MCILECVGFSLHCLLLLALGRVQQRTQHNSTHSRRVYALVRSKYALRIKYLFPLWKLKTIIRCATEKSPGHEWYNANISNELCQLCKTDWMMNHHIYYDQRKFSERALHFGYILFPTMSADEKHCEFTHAVYAYDAHAHTNIEKESDISIVCISFLSHSRSVVYLWAKNRAHRLFAHFYRIVKTKQ